MTAFKINTVSTSNARVDAIASLFGIESHLNSGLYEHVCVTPTTPNIEMSAEASSFVGLDALISHATNTMIILKMYDSVLTYTFKEIIETDPTGNLTLGDTLHDLDGTIPCKGMYTDGLFSVFLNRVVGESKLVDVNSVLLDLIYVEPETGCFVKPREKALTSPEAGDVVVIYDYLWSNDAKKHNTTSSGHTMKSRVVFEETFIKSFKMLK